MSQITPDELEALRAFAAAHGRSWKRALAETYWPRARLWRDDDGSTAHGEALHGLRNRLGPAWLARFQLAPSQRLPVLDDNTADAMVLGWASSVAGAYRVAQREAIRLGHEGVVSVHLESDVRLRYDPDLHTRAEIARAERVGRRAYIMTVEPLSVPLPGISREELDKLVELLRSPNNLDSDYALLQLGEWADRGILRPELEDCARRLEGDYICCLNTGEIVAWGAEFTLYPGRIEREVIVISEPWK